MVVRIIAPTALLIACLALAACSTGEPLRGVSPAPLGALELVNSELSKYQLTLDQGLPVLSSF